MTDNISIRAMVSYEKQTKGNALELIAKENKTFTDLVWIAYLVAYTKDQTTTFEKIENLNSAEFHAILNGLNADSTAA